MDSNEPRIVTHVDGSKLRPLDVRLLLEQVQRERDQALEDINHMRAAGVVFDESEHAAALEKKVAEQSGIIHDLREALTQEGNRSERLVGLLQESSDKIASLEGLVSQQKARIEELERQMAPAPSTRPENPNPEPHP